MKKQVLVVALFLISMIGFAQKAEMKMAKKAISSKNFTEALSAISKLETMTLDDKTKAKFMYFKAQALKGSGSIMKAATAISDLKAFESKIGKAKYTKLVTPMLTEIIKGLSDRGIKEYSTDKNFKLAKVTLEQVYNLSKKDTVFLEYAANAAYLDKDYDKALTQFIALRDMGYTNITTLYTAKNAEGEVKSFNSEKEMKNMVALGAFNTPKTTVTESKLATIIKYIAFIYVEKGDKAKALTAIKDARKANPTDANLVITEGNIELELGNKERFSELMKEAIALDPKNATLYYNIGVVSQQAGKMEEAKAAYKKSIELDSENANSYLNLGLAILDADKILVEQLNNENDFDKYDAINAKRKVIFNEALPYFETAHKLNKSDLGIMQTLKNLYQNLEMYDKEKEIKALYNK